MAKTGRDEKAPRRRSLGQHIQKNMIAGVLTLFPLVVTAVVLIWSLGILSYFGEPVVRGMARLIEADHPTLAAWLEHPFFINVVSVLVVFAAIYLIGWLASQIIGAKLLEIFQGMINRIPLVGQLYSSMTKLLDVLQTRPDNIKRVVMIEFPHTEMKALGFVTRILKDESTGRDLAAVFVPTTPNPTGGYLEIVPVERLVSTDLSLEEALNFIVSGGAIAPDHIAFSMSTPNKSKPADLPHNV
jgi:uncharacterized membrane protein